MSDRASSERKVPVRTAQPRTAPPHTVHIVIPRRSPLVRYLRLAASLLILLAACYGIYSLASPLLGFPAAVSRQSTSDPSRALEEHRRDAIAAEARRTAERKAAFKERLRATLDRGERLRNRTGELVKEADAWEKKVVPLLTNEEGRLLSAERHWVDSFEEFYQGERPSAAAADELRSRLEILIEPLQEAWDSGDFSSAPGGSVGDRLTELEQGIEHQIQAAKSPRLKIESLLLAAKQEGQKGERTLDEAIQFYKAQAEERAARVARVAKQKAEAESDETLRLEEEEQARQQEQLKIREAEKETQLAELRALLKEGKTRQLLAPFITPGYFQPDRSISAKKVPISYSKLVSAGCLEESERGLDRLRNLVKDNTDKVRPRWDVNQYLENLPTESYEKLVNAQTFLRDHGELMVELGALSP